MSINVNLAVDELNSMHGDIRRAYNVVRIGKTSFGKVFYDINLEVDSYLPHGKTASDIKENESTSIDNIIPTSAEIVKAFDKEYLSLAKDPKKNEARLRELVDAVAKKAMPAYSIGKKTKPFSYFPHRGYNSPVQQVYPMASSIVYAIIPQMSTRELIMFLKANNLSYDLASLKQ